MKAITEWTCGFQDTYSTFDESWEGFNGLSTVSIISVLAVSHIVIIITKIKTLLYNVETVKGNKVHSQVIRGVHGVRIRFSHESVLVDPGRRSMWSPLSNGLRSFRLRIVSPTSCSLTFEFVSRTCWVSSLTAFAWSVAERTRYIHTYRNVLYRGWENEAYTCAVLVSLLSRTT